jgi:hypothetical protein
MGRKPQLKENKMLTITNDFHNTQTAIRAKAGDVLTLRRVRSVQSKLCGVPNCTCGGTLGERGKQAFAYEVEFDRGGVSGVRIL